MTTGALRGVICLIPKRDDGEPLKNWRPITMLSLIYKVVRKLLALCLEAFMSTLVYKEQFGFIKGRWILDNIILLKIGKEFVIFKKLAALLLKLDFMKAYNRLDQLL